MLCSVARSSGFQFNDGDRLCRSYRKSGLSVSLDLMLRGVRVPTNWGSVVTHDLRVSLGFILGGGSGFIITARFTPFARPGLLLSLVYLASLVSEWFAQKDAHLGFRA